MEDTPQNHNSNPERDLALSELERALNSENPVPFGILTEQEERPEVLAQYTPEPPPVYVAPPPVPETKPEPPLSSEIESTKLPPLLGQIDPVIEEKGSVDKTPLMEEKNESAKESPLEKELKSARAQYVALEARYKKKVKEGRGTYEKLMGALGAQGKKYPVPEKDPEHKATEEAYFRAKWNARKLFVDTKEIPLEYSNSLIDKKDTGIRKIDVGATNFSEDERRLLQRLVEEAGVLPAKEKGAVRKVLEKGFLKYSRLSPARRIAVSTTLIMGGTFLTGGIALGAVAGAGAIRAAKGLVGVGAAGVAGEAFDGIKRKKQEEVNKERREQYGEEVGKIDGIDENDPHAYAMFRAPEDKQIELDEKEVEQDKRDRLKKAALMAEVGGVSAVASGAVVDQFLPSGTEASVLETKNTGGKVVAPENVPIKKPGFLDKLLGKNPDTEAPAPVAEVPRSTPPTPEALQTPKVVETPPVALDIEGKVDVPLSSKGYIATIAELQEQLKSKTLSPKLSELLKEPPEKIAIKLGLYKPDQVDESALGFKGDQLTLDAEGNISLMHRDATLDTLVKSDGTISEYKGKMFDADAVSPVEALPPQPAEVPVVFNEMGTVDTIPAEVVDTPIKDTTTAEVETTPTPVPPDGREYALLSPEYKEPNAIVLGLAPIMGKYQFGKEYQPQRNAYSRFIRRELMGLVPGSVDSMFAVPYQGGMIDIFQKGKDITLLLNGEKIGTASLFPDGNIGFQYESKLGKGMSGVKSEYEQAFDFAQGEVEKNKKFFKVST